MRKTVTILIEDPVIEVLADMRLREAGVLKMAEWVKRHRPDCVPEGGFQDMWDLLPHNDRDRPHDGDYDPTGPSRKLSDNEVLAEIAGRKCYDSFAQKAGKKTNLEYLEHIFSMDPVHASINYHAQMTFFFAGVSRKFSHQFIRNYVGSQRDEEGAPSQESTRFTHHYGFYVAPPFICGDRDEIEEFRIDCQANYDVYTEFLSKAVGRYTAKHGKPPIGAHRKDIYEASAGLLNMSAETSFVWTTNPMAITKFLKERCHDAADAEIFRFSRCLARISFEEWKNFFIGKQLDAVRKEVYG